MKKEEYEGISTFSRCHKKKYLLLARLNQEFNELRSQILGEAHFEGNFL